MSTETPSRTILLSGGSRGLGLALVRHLLAGGHAVATFARNETPAVAALAREQGDRFLFSAFDGRDAAATQRFVAAAIERFGGIDGLVNNAAVGQDHLLVNLSPERITELLEINVRAPVLLTRAVVRHMLVEGRRGRIVTITSICGSRGYAGLTVYSATKGAMDAFTRSLARELGPRGILVNAIAPGFFLSEMSSVLAKEQIETIRRRTPTERLVTDEDVVPFLDLFLFGESNVTGQVAYVDGGLTF
ncbi:MAG TPA: SDR family NAD(P)-dependent oxidoreductase [Candidatus Acidoferrales bacterium]|nr:SDR family NAD(P)-dependent oxidoreductase [Candidatus Acidoferrales bacterium]